MNPTSSGLATAPAAEQPVMRGWARWRAQIALVVILSGVALNGLLTSVLAPVLSTAAKHFGAGAGGQFISQTIVTMSTVGIMVGGPAAGWLTERIGVRYVLFLSLIVYGIAGSAGLYLDDVTALFAARFIQGFASSGIALSTYIMIGDQYDGVGRQRILGYQGAFIAASGFIMVQVAGQVAEVGGWRAPFGLYLISFVVLGMAMVSIDANRKRRAEAPTAIVPDSSLLALWPSYLMAVLLYMVGWMVYLQLSFVLAGDGISSPAVQSRIVATSTVMHFIGGLLYGWVAAKIGTKWMFFSMLAMMATSNIVIGLTHTITPIMIGVGLAGLGGGNLLIYLTNFFLERAPEVGRPRAIGFMLTALYIGEFLNPVLLTPLRTAIGNHVAFIVVGAALAAAAAARAVIRDRGAAAN